MKDVKPAPEALEIGIDGECPVCAKNPPFNAVAAMQEAKDMMSGKAPTKWYHCPIEEAREDLGI
jgi:hypothetical protein